MEEKVIKEKITKEQISQKIRKFLFENYLFGYDENEFSNDSSFLDFGVLDSTGILELIVFIESEFNIEVEDSEILPENLDSVDCVSRLVYKKIN
ncbi:MAG: acyl carrier protein [Bacillota bacterium]|nr:acyl carrier protein [Bacillota bacterium]